MIIDHTYNIQNEKKEQMMKEIINTKNEIIRIVEKDNDVKKNLRMDQESTIYKLNTIQ